MTELLAAYRAALRTDFLVFYERCFALLEPGTAFLDNWHIHAVADVLRGVQEGDLKRLIVNVPPRSGKSTLVSVAFTAWLLGHDPRLKIICVSYSESLAKTHAAAFRSTTRCDWFSRAFPAFQVARGGDRSAETITTQHGFRYAVSIAGPVMGRGADIIIADDALSPEAALSDAVRLRELNLWDTAHRTRLNDKQRGAIVLVSQRLHQGDLVGHVLASGDWERLVIPAIATEAKRYKVGPSTFYDREADKVMDSAREPREALDEMRRAIGSMQFSAQYMQEPVPPEGNLVHREWLRFYEERPPDIGVLVATWDTASTIEEHSSYSVGMLWGAVEENYYLLELLRGRFEAPDLRRKIIEHNAMWKPDATLIEDTELGRSLHQDLRKTERLRTLLRSPRYDKKARLLAQLARFEDGQVHLPKDAPWLSCYVDELLAFPRSRHNDQVDATSQVLDYFTSILQRRKPFVRQNIKRRSIIRR